jgi:pimeloyl-ACP methyl ester carboxylesterase
LTTVFRPHIPILLLLASLAVLGACGALDRDQPTTKRVIIIQGVCSSSAIYEEPGHWTTGVKSILASEFSLVDLPTGDPDDQVIEFGYSASGWDEDYLPTETLRSVPETSRALQNIYSAYPNSEFFVLGHSLGGVITLDGLARYSDTDNKMLERTSGVITVSSPVQGLTEANADVARIAIELVACRQFTGADAEPSAVWADIQDSGQSIALIHDTDWTGNRVVNFANKRDRVVNWQTAILESHFSVSCYETGRQGLLSLNHDTLLAEPDSATELMDVLINGATPAQGCWR